MVVDSHMITFDELCARYNTDINNGKTKAAAEEDFAKYGPNRWVLIHVFISFFNDSLQGITSWVG